MTTEAGWTIHSGGQCPLTKDTVVVVRFRNHEKAVRLIPDVGRAVDYNWTHDGGWDDITEYSVRVPEQDMSGCLRHVTEILEEWSRYHASEMTCDIAAALHNARAALAGSPDPGQRAEPAAWMHPTAGWARESYDEVRMHCMNDGPMPIPLYRGPPAPSQQLVGDREWPRNPFKRDILKKQFAACVYCYFSRDKDFFRADGSRHTGNGVANAFWRGFDGVYKPGHWDGSKDTPAYASYRAGEMIAAYERSITPAPQTRALVPGSSEESS